MNKNVTELLKNVTYYKSKDDEQYTPSQMFESIYTRLIDDPEEYFKEYTDDIGQEEADEEREVFVKNGKGHSGAFAVIKSQLESLNQITLDYKETK